MKFKSKLASVEFVPPALNEKQSSKIHSLGYDDCLIHTGINAGINENGTFVRKGDNEIGRFLKKPLIESGIFNSEAVIELTTFLSDAVTELKTICLARGIEFGTIAKQGDNELNISPLGGVDECGTIFKYLIKYVSGEINSVAVINSNSLNHSTVPLDGEGGEEIEREIEFDFFAILNRCNVSYVKQQELKEIGVSVQALISMLLFIASPRGERLGMGYVITRLLENPKGLTDQYGELASLPAERLIQSIRDALQMNVLGEYEWRIVMGGAQDAKLDELLYRLIGEKFE